MKSLSYRWRYGRLGMWAGWLLVTFLWATGVEAVCEGCIPDTPLLGTIYVDNLGQADEFGPHLVQIALTPTLNDQGNRIAEMTIGPRITLDPDTPPVCIPEVSGTPINSIGYVPGIEFDPNTRELFGWGWTQPTQTGSRRGSSLEIDPATGIARGLCTPPDDRSHYSTDMTISRTPQTWDIATPANPSAGTNAVEYAAGTLYMLNFENYLDPGTPTSVYWASQENYLVNLLVTALPFFNEQDRILSDGFVGLLPFGFAAGYHRPWFSFLFPPIPLSEEVPLFTIVDEFPLTTAPPTNPLEEPLWLGFLANDGTVEIGAEALTRADGEWVGIPTAIVYSKDFDGNPTLLVAANRSYRATDGTFVLGERVLYEIPLENIVNEPGFILGINSGSNVPPERIYQVRIPDIPNLAAEEVPAILDLAQALYFDFPYLPFQKMSSSSAMKAKKEAMLIACGYPSSKQCPDAKLYHAIDQATFAMDRGSAEQASQKLAALRERLNGCTNGGAPDADDWIYDCADQTKVNQHLAAAAENLNLALQIKAALRQPTAKLWPNTNFAAQWHNAKLQRGDAPPTHLETGWPPQVE